MFNHFIFIPTHIFCDKGNKTISYLKTRMSLGTRCACTSCQRKKQRVKNTSRSLIFPVYSHINIPQKDYQVIYALRMT